uniref:Uncharacterized protein n=1 Tax=Nymphaea colorata TaxID=210225 RepID=A0A5K1F6Y2_9MAGN|nr:unnamed protein product [Nymphaea colorata]
MGRPVPVPPQLLHGIRAEPAHVLQPTSSSDQREQRQLMRPVPLQLGQRGLRSPPAMGSCSIADFTSIAPASTPSPVANWVSTIRPILLSGVASPRERRDS